MHPGAADSSLLDADEDGLIMLNCVFNNSNGDENFASNTMYNNAPQTHKAFVGTSVVRENYVYEIEKNLSLDILD